MNNLEVILESIINEGNTESQKILDEANAKANELHFFFHLLSH